MRRRLRMRVFSGDEVRLLRALVAGFSDEDAERVKAIERTTNHDVKAVEYFLKKSCVRPRFPPS
jgi:adenylosuccinate lyase